MEELRDLIDSWDLESSLSPKIMKTILDIPKERCGGIYDELPNLPLLSSTLLHKIQSYLQRIKGIDQFDINSLPELQILFVVLFIFLQSTSNDHQDGIICCQLLLSIVAIPGSSAYGLINGNILNTISLKINKAIVNELQSNAQPTVKASKKKKGKKGGEADEEADSENEEHKMDTDDSIAANRDQRQTVIRRLQPSTLSALLIELESSVAVHLSRNEDSITEQLVDALCGVVYLTALRNEFKGSLAQVSNVFMSIGKASFPSFAIVIRHFMPSLSFAGRDFRLPDNPKLRNSCHHAAVEVLGSLLSMFHKAFIECRCEGWYTPAEDTAMHMSDNEEDDDKNDDKSPVRRKGGQHQHSSGGNSSDLIFQNSLDCFCCSVVGILQRMTINSPEKAPIKQVVLESICHLLHHIIDLGSQQQEQQQRSSSIHQFHPIIQHYLHFLTKLCKSNRLGYRSFAVDIICAILLPSDNSSASSSGSSNSDQNALHSWLWDDSTNIIDVEQLLLILLKRCNDIAPTVRLRALTAVCDVLQSFSPQMPMKFTKIMLRYALGTKISTYVPVETTPTSHHRRVSLDPRGVEEESSTETSNDSSHFNLIDLLRNRTFDNKPLVKAKAIQAYGLVFSIKWIKINDLLTTSTSATAPGAVSSTPRCDEITMLLSQEDIDVFMKSCMDMSSISIRKQALSSLSAILQFRYGDSSLQEGWIHSALPLIADTETTIVQRVVKVTEEIFLDPLLKWSKTPELPSSSSPATSLLWDLCGKIANHHRENFLRMIFLNFIKNETLQRNNLKGVFKAIWQACSHVEESICRSGWILLESILNHPLAGGNQSSLTTTEYLQKDKFDFIDAIVEYYKRHVSYSNGDEEIVRVLRIMHTLSASLGTLTAGQSSYLLTEMNRINTSFTIPSTGLIQSAIQIRCSLSQASSDMFVDMTGWVSGLLGNIHSILHAIVWKILPTEANKLSPHILHHLHQYIAGELTANEIASITKLALYELGELIMLGFANDEDESSFVQQKGVSSYSISSVNPKLYKMIINEEITQLLQLCMSATFPQSSGMSSLSSTAPIPADIRAYAFVCMGKLCLRNFSLSRKHINVFLREIQLPVPSFSSLTAATENPYLVKNNCILILNDLCIRYTNLIENHIDLVAEHALAIDPTHLRPSSLSSPSPGHLLSPYLGYQHMYRRHCIIILSQLILQDYIKCRDHLVYRILLCCLDNTAEIQDLVHMTLQKIFLVKASGFIVNKFSELIVILNNCYDHPLLRCSNQIHKSIQDDSTPGILTQASQSRQQTASASQDTYRTNYYIAGNENRALRMRVYEYLLQGISEEQRIQVTAKIVSDILSSTVDNYNHHHRLGAAELDVIWDTFLLLQSPLLRIGKSSAAAIASAVAMGGTEELETAMADEEIAASRQAQIQAVTKARNKVLKTISKQHMINHILPVIMSLKHILESMKSSLQGHLMEYLAYMMSQHRSEVLEVLNSDPILKSELEYDLKQYERQKEKITIQREAQQALAATDKVLQSTTKRALSECASATKQRLSSASKPMSTVRRLSAMKSRQVEVEDVDSFVDRLVSFEDNGEESYPPVPPSAKKQQRWSISVNPIETVETDENLTAANNNNQGKRTKRKGAAKSKAVNVDRIEEEESHSPDKKKVNIITTPDYIETKTISKSRVKKA